MCLPKKPQQKTGNCYYTHYWSVFATKVENPWQVHENSYKLKLASPVNSEKQKKKAEHFTGVGII